MAQIRRGSDKDLVGADPSIPRTKADKITPAEITRRRALFNEAMRLREELVLVGVSTADLIREGRDELDGEDRGTTG